MPFDPAQLTPAASLNRVLLTEGASPLRPAFELLSARALTELILAHGRELEPGPEANDDTIAAFDRLLQAFGPQRDAAVGVAETFVRRMALLITTLKTGPPSARAARLDWDASYWQAWSKVSLISLGGGMLSGNLGALVRGRLPAVLAEAGIEVEVEVSTYPRSLPLIGTARSLETPTFTAAVLDFGHTSIKRAAAFHGAGGQLDSLSLLEPAPSPMLGTGDSTEKVEKLGGWMAGTIAGTWREVQSLGAGNPPSTEVVCSVACYMHDGHPYPESVGTYAALRALSPNLAGWLSEQVSARLGRDITVRLVHDGTAAARALPRRHDAAVIMFGTALGVGFAPRDQPLSVLSPGFAVR